MWPQMVVLGLMGERKITGWNRVARRTSLWFPGDTPTQAVMEGTGALALVVKRGRIVARGRCSWFCG